MTGQVQFSLEITFFWRVFAAFCWGLGWAVYLQFSRRGRWLAEERTWITVVVGIGVDLLIAFNADWLTCAAVIIASSGGIIWRSLVNEKKRAGLGRNKTLWAFEDVVVLTKEAMEIADDVVESLADGPSIVRARELIQKLQRAHLIASGALNGHYG